MWFKNVSLQILAWGRGWCNSDMLSILLCCYHDTDSLHNKWIHCCYIFELVFFNVVALHDASVFALVKFFVYFCVECNKILLQAISWMVSTLVWGNTSSVIVFPLLLFMVSLLMFWWCHCDCCVTLLLLCWCHCCLHCDACCVDFYFSKFLQWHTLFPKKQRNNHFWWLMKDNHLEHSSNGQQNCFHRCHNYFPLG